METNLGDVELLRRHGRQLVKEVLRDRVLESKFDQKVVNAEPEFLRPHEPFHHPDDGRAFAVGYCVEHGVYLIGGVDSDDDGVRAEGCVL